MTKLEQIFDELEENGTECFEGLAPQLFDRIYREDEDLELSDVLGASVAWLFTDSVGQALAIDD